MVEANEVQHKTVKKSADKTQNGATLNGVEN